jgi:DNA (cytosine-5)-methyltransferase 1
MDSYKGLINREILPHASGALPSAGLFAGILGIELGLARAGFYTVAALDFDPNAKTVVEANRERLGAFPYFCENICNFAPGQLLESSGLRKGELALLAGGPPCQPFSKSGLRLGSDDARGQLFRRYLDFLKAIEPQAFLLENVRGLFSSRHGKDFAVVLEEFKRTGYTVYWRILDAASYGVPQFRQRLFLVGFKDRLRFEWPAPTHEDPQAASSDLFDERTPYVTVGEAIQELEHDLSSPPYSGRFANLLRDIPEGLNYSYYCSERDHPHPLFQWRSRFWYFLLKIDRSRPSLTLQAHPGNNTGPFHWNNRRLTVPELLRLQSFPDWLRVDLPYFKAHQVIGNAVPPLFSEALGHSVKSALDRAALISDVEYERTCQVEYRTNGFVRSGRGSGKGKVKRRV